MFQTPVRKEEVDDGTGVTGMLINRVSFTVGTLSKPQFPIYNINQVIISLR